MKVKIDNYIFNKTTKTIVFTDYSSVRLDGLLLITNVTRNIIIYNFADPLKGGTIVANVLTLTYNTSAMADTDKLLIYYDDGSVVGKEESTSTSTDIQKESQEISETEIGINIEDLLLKAMDGRENMPFYVKLPKDLKQEADGSLLIADMKGPIIWNSTTVATAPIVIDCIGYQSILVHKTTSGIVTPTVSNDGNNFVATLTAPISTMVAAATMPTAVNIYVMPVVARYLKLTGPASAVTCFIYLSQSPFQSIIAVSNQSTNIAQVAGTNTVTAGLGGTLAVGGNIASGTTPTTYPVQIGGVDDLKVPLTRRSLVDSLGRSIIATQTGQIPGTTGVNTPLNTIGYLSTYKNILAVQEIGTNEEGETEVGILSQILFELKILNQQIYELPRLIDEGRYSNDEPKQFREQTNNLFE